MRLVTVLTFVLLVGGCAGERSDKTDGAPSSPDGALTWPDTGGPDTVSPAWEGGPQLDTVPPLDLGPIEGGAGGKSCGEIADCAKLCTDMACGQNCLNTGCASAQALAQSLISCGIQYCASSCIYGLNQACLTCVSTNCPNDYNACLSHSC